MIYVSVNETQSTNVSVNSGTTTAVDVSQAAVGTAGGYYVPSLISGYIHWEPSKSNMPAVQDSYIGLKYDTTANWNAQPSFVPYAGEMVIYSDYMVKDGVVYAGVKVGDGDAYLVDLPFLGDAVMDTLNAHIMDAVHHITQEERVKWNSKLTCTEDGENLIFVNG